MSYLYLCSCFLVADRHQNRDIGENKGRKLTSDSQNIQNLNLPIMNLGKELLGKSHAKVSRGTSGSGNISGNEVMSLDLMLVCGTWLHGSDGH